MAFSVLLNIPLSLILMQPLKIAGLTLASSVTATVNAAQLYYLLRKKIGSLHGEKLIKSFLKIILVSMATGVVAAGYNHFMIMPAIQQPHKIQILHLFSAIGLSILVYLGLSFAIGIEEAKKLFIR